MTDAAIEREYEERLQAAARYLQVWVEYQDGRRILRRTFMDTPEGRQSAAKNANTWTDLPLVERVEVVPTEAGTGRREPPALDAKRTPPASVRATCEAGARLCTPQVRIQPSGRRLFHSLDCPDTPGAPIDTRSYAQGRAWPPRGRVR